MHVFDYSFFCPQTKTLFAQFMNLTIFEGHFTGPPSYGQLSEPVDQPLLFDHGQVALPARAAVMVPHGPAHLFVVHLFAPVGLHPAPGPGKLHGVAHLEDAVALIDPADDPGVVGLVV